MDIYRRYFKVINGDIIDFIKAANAINKKAREKYMQIAESIGATRKYYHRDERLCGFIFEKAPDSGVFKSTKWGWYPKRNCKKGKELVERLKAVETKDPQEALKLVGLNNSPTLFGAGKCYFPTLIFIPDDTPVVYITVPWYDEDPETLEKYKKENAEGVHYCGNYDAVLWEPTPEMEEVKKWQVERHIDEWNEKAKAA